MGEKEKAFPFLEKCVEHGDIWAYQLHWPDFDSLRGDPRFDAVVRRMGLPVEVYRRPARENATTAR